MTKKLSSFYDGGEDMKKHFGKITNFNAVLGIGVILEEGKNTAVTFHHTAVNSPKLGLNYLTPGDSVSFETEQDNGILATNVVKIR